MRQTFCMFYLRAMSPGRRIRGPRDRLAMTIGRRGGRYCGESVGGRRPNLATGAGMSCSRSRYLGDYGLGASGGRGGSEVW